MRAAQTVFVVCAALILAACTSDHIVGRYKTIQCQKEGETKLKTCNGDPPSPAATASAVSIATAPATATAGGGSLPERALAEYIRALSDPKSAEKAEDLRKDIAALSKGDDSSSGDQTILHRTIVVSVVKDRDLAPADRLYSTDVTLQLDGKVAKFIDWDTLASTYNTISAGTVQLTQARGLTEGLTSTLTVPPVAVTPSLGGSQTDTRVENFTASPQVEGLSATINDKRDALTIHRTGGNGLELAGNTVIKVDMEYTGPANSTYVYSVDSYVDKDGKPISPEKLKLKRKGELAIPPGTSIFADVSMKYAVWHVTSGGNTYEEIDDDVQKIDGDMAATKVELVPAREGSPTGFTLRLDAMIVHAAKGGVSSELCFKSYSDAVDFLSYLSVNPSNAHHVGDFDLRFETPVSDTPLSAGLVGRLHVQYGCL